MHFTSQIVTDFPECQDFATFEKLTVDGKFLLISEQKIGFREDVIHLASFEELSDANIQLEYPADIPDTPENPINAATWAFLATLEQTNYFAISVSEESFDGITFKGVRSTLSDEHTQLSDLAAKGIVQLLWREKNKFSACSGKTLRPTALGTRLERGQDKFYPRINPVVITLVQSKCGNYCLLGRGSRYPTSMYSCLAGFVEVGETLHQAAAREIFEETGVHISEIEIWRSQPWPCSRRGYELMIGLFATADKNSKITIQRSELTDARWFSKEEVRIMLTRGWDRENKADFYVPGPYAIAHHLIKEFVTRDHKKKEWNLSWLLGMSFGVILGVGMMKMQAMSKR